MLSCKCHWLIYTNFTRVMYMQNILNTSKHVFLMLRYQKVAKITPQLGFTWFRHIRVIYLILQGHQSTYGRKSCTVIDIWSQAIPCNLLRLSAFPSFRFAKGGESSPLVGRGVSHGHESSQLSSTHPAGTMALNRNVMRHMHGDRFTRIPIGITTKFEGND